MGVAEASLECVSRQAAATLLAAALAGASREGGKSRDPPFPQSISPPPQIQNLAVDMSLRLNMDFQVKASEANDMPAASKAC